MTPKEKAEQLITKFDLPTGLMSKERKECAVIAVQEILDEFECLQQIHSTFESYLEYWNEVKQEIIKYK